MINVMNGISVHFIEVPMVNLMNGTSVYFIEVPMMSLMDGTNNYYKVKYQFSRLSSYVVH